MMRTGASSADFACCCTSQLPCYMGIDAVVALQAGSQASSAASGSDADSALDSGSDSDSDSSADSQPARPEQDLQAARSNGDGQVQQEEAASGMNYIQCVHVQICHTC